MAGAQKNKKESIAGEDVPKSSQSQRLESISSSSRSFGSQSLSKFYRYSGAPSVQSFKAKKVISF